MDQEALGKSRGYTSRHWQTTIEGFIGAESRNSAQNTRSILAKFAKCYRQKESVRPLLRKLCRAWAGRSCFHQNILLKHTGMFERRGGVVIWSRGEWGLGAWGLASGGV